MGRKPIKGIFQELPLWATGTQSHLGIVENGMEHTSQSLSYKGMRKLGNLYTYSFWSLVEGFCEGGCTQFLASLICHVHLGRTDFSGPRNAGAARWKLA